MPEITRSDAFKQAQPADWKPARDEHVYLRPGKYSVKRARLEAVLDLGLARVRLLTEAADSFGDTSSYNVGRSIQVLLADLRPITSVAAKPAAAKPAAAKPAAAKPAKPTKKPAAAEPEPAPSAAPVQTAIARKSDPPTSQQAAAQQAGTLSRNKQRFLDALRALGEPSTAAEVGERAKQFAESAGQKVMPETIRKRAGELSAVLRITGTRRCKISGKQACIYWFAQ